MKQIAQNYKSGELLVLDVPAPAFARLSINVGPKGSLPTRPTISTRPPSSAAAQAWFAPFPPATILKSLPVTVSPDFGNRSTRCTRSAFRLPATTMFLCFSTVFFIARRLSVARS